MTSLRRWAIALAALSPWLAPPGHLEAKPSGPMAFCAEYSEARVCQGQLPTCEFCHTSTYPPAWNDFGVALFPGLAGGAFTDKVGEAARAIDQEDSDGDGVSNLEELVAGTSPGSNASVYRVPEPQERPPNPSYDVEGYDVTFALRRLTLTYCGVSPSYEQLQEFKAAPDPRAVLHDVLDGCLASGYWRDIALPRLADPRVRPLFAVGQESPVGIRLADYKWDYQLFVYVLTGDRDARDLLLADYHVARMSDGTLMPVEGPVAGGGGYGDQPLVPNQRAGMITTKWFIMINTMFTPLPRTTAAQAYRAYLGHDISSHEGIRPVANEPQDIDNKGVKAAECASCHSTLDPLSYAFSFYHGINGPTGIYDPSRPGNYVPGWNDPQAAVLGKSVASVVEWASVAADSEDFQRNLAEMFFAHALGRGPRPQEQAEFEAMWRALPEDEYSANKLIHRLIDTLAFGAP